MNSATLNTPVKIDGKDVAKIKLRKPRAGEMRGLSLVSVLQLDIATLIRLVPRISNPPLSEDQVADMEADDILAIGTQVALFFQGTKLPGIPPS